MWYPFELGMADEGIEEAGGGMTSSRSWRGPTRGTRRGGVHRGFLSPATRRSFAKTLTIYFTSLRPAGGPEDREKDTATTRVPRRAPGLPTVVGWYRRALEMCGAQAPRVVEEECRAKGGSVCRYRLSWS
jgi:hypothetical protein